MVGLLSVLVHRIGRRIEYVFYLIKENKFVLIFFSDFGSVATLETATTSSSSTILHSKTLFCNYLLQLERGGGCR